MKTAELTGPALDWAVEECEFVGTPPIKEVSGVLYTVEGYYWNPSTNWALGGPIIEREGINIGTIDALNGPYWEAHMPYGMSDDFADGPTPLIAAMRCYVASKLGDEVDIPEELT